MSLDNAGPEIGFEKVPFVMDVDGREFVDDENLSVPELVDAMEAADKSHSACPSPAAWETAFRKADRIIAMTISGRLSGSYNSAMVGKAMALESNPEKQIEVIDSLSTGPKLVLLAQDAVRQIQAHASFEDVCASARAKAESVRTIFTLCSFHNLVQNGRVPKVAGLLAGKLGIRVIGVGTPGGEIHVKEALRGEQRVLKHIVKDMEDQGYQGQNMAISHCLNEQLAQALRDMILARWAQARVRILPTRGLDSYYAERSGLIVSYPTA